ncbi:hypothetical protein BE21_55900 [Sorangium cellulosum]|uniref:SF3 helicase domain-containing protein n=1 Tax=Sorangium cellulosum TaxID=56 RepID=A0A150TBD0_SORCE|nr:hypothetical protein BE21_55900 [Sorangium cellulosum]
MHAEPTSAQPSTAGPERHHDDETRAANDVEPSEPSDHGDAKADADQAGDDEPISRGDGLCLDACGTSMVPAGASAGHGAANGNGAPHAILTLRQGTAPDSDLANAERLVALYGRDLRHVEALGGWHRWTGSRWCCDRSTAAEVAKETTRRLLTDARLAMSEAAERVKRAHDDDEAAKAKAQHKEATALFNWAKRSQSARGIDAMLRLAETEPIVRAEPGDFDADPWLLNCRNGVLDLRTGELRDHDRRDMMRRIVPVAFEPDAELPIWDRFLADVTGNDEEMIGFLRRATGYTLTGDVRHEVLFFVHGPPASGKSTFLEALKITMGEYAAKADFETFIARRDAGGPRNDIARLAGARLVLSIEVDEGKRLAEGLVKQLTGGDTVTARFLYRESFEFKPAFKLWLAANDAPRVRDDDAAIWRRILRIPFEHTVPKEKRDPQVKAALLDPAVGGPAILAWAVRGCREWLERGLDVPASITRATEAYRAENDPLRDFIHDRCVVAEEAWVEKAALRREYERWCQDNGNKYPLGSKRFAVRIRNVGASESTKRVPGHRTPRDVWLGIGLRHQGDDRQQEAGDAGL